MHLRSRFEHEKSGILVGRVYDRSTVGDHATKPPSMCTQETYALAEAVFLYMRTALSTCIIAIIA